MTVPLLFWEPYTYSEDSFELGGKWPGKHNCFQHNLKQFPVERNLLLSTLIFLSTELPLSLNILKDFQPCVILIWSGHWHTMDKRHPRNRYARPWRGTESVSIERSRYHLVAEHLQLSGPWPEYQREWSPADESTGAFDQARRCVPWTLLASPLPLYLQLSLHVKVRMPYVLPYEDACKSRRQSFSSNNWNDSWSIKWSDINLVSCLRSSEGIGRSRGTEEPRDSDLSE